jgi:hypothetical protein
VQLVDACCRAEFDFIEPTLESQNSSFESHCQTIQIFELIFLCEIEGLGVKSLDLWRGKLREREKMEREEEREIERHRKRHTGRDRERRTGDSLDLEGYQPSMRVGQSDGGSSRSQHSPGG